jgi:hypothetical protein
MLTGPMASNYCGILRTTHDLDFVIQLPPSDALKMIDAFRSDFYLGEAAIQTAYQPPFQFNAIDKRSPLKVDFWLLKPAPFENEIFARRIRTTVIGETAWIATAEDVMLHKLYWNRLTPSHRQLGDAAGVVSVQRGNLDVAYLRQWAKELKLSDTLEDLLAGRIQPKATDVQPVPSTSLQDRARKGDPTSPTTAAVASSAVGRR